MLSHLAYQAFLLCKNVHIVEYVLLVWSINLNNLYCIILYWIMIFALYCIYIYIINHMHACEILIFLVGMFSFIVNFWCSKSLCNYFKIANKLVQWFVFKAIQKTCSTIVLKFLAELPYKYFKPDKTMLLVF